MCVYTTTSHNLQNWRKKKLLILVLRSRLVWLKNNNKKWEKKNLQQTTANVCGIWSVHTTGLVERIDWLIWTTHIFTIISFVVNSSFSSSSSSYFLLSFMLLFFFLFCITNTNAIKFKQKWNKTNTTLSDMNDFVIFVFFLRSINCYCFIHTQNFTN